MAPFLRSRYPEIHLEGFYLVNIAVNISGLTPSLALPRTISMEFTAKVTESLRSMKFTTTFAMEYQESRNDNIIRDDINNAASCHPELVEGSHEKGRRQRFLDFARNDKGSDMLHSE